MSSPHYDDVIPDFYATTMSYKGLHTSTKQTSRLQDSRLQDKSFAEQEELPFRSQALGTRQEATLEGTW